MLLHGLKLMREKIKMLMNRKEPFIFISISHGKKYYCEDLALKRRESKILMLPPPFFSLNLYNSTQSFTKAP